MSFGYINDQRSHKILLRRVDNLISSGLYCIFMQTKQKFRICHIYVRSYTDLNFTQFSKNCKLFVICTFNITNFTLDYLSVFLDKYTMFLKLFFYFVCAYFYFSLNPTGFLKQNFLRNQGLILRSSALY